MTLKFSRWTALTLSKTIGFHIHWLSTWERQMPFAMTKCLIRLDCQYTTKQPAKTARKQLAMSHDLTWWVFVFNWLPSRLVQWEDPKMSCSCQNTRASDSGQKSQQPNQLRNEKRVKDGPWFHPIPSRHNRGRGWRKRENTFRHQWLRNAPSLPTLLRKWAFNLKVMQLGCDKL